MALSQNERDRLTRLEAMFSGLDHRVEGHHRTLYGTQGNGGLQADVHNILVRVETHITAETEASERTAILLVGEKGDAGVVRDMSELKGEVGRAKNFARALGVLIGAILVDLVVRLMHTLTAGA